MTQQHTAEKRKVFRVRDRSRRLVAEHHHVRKGDDKECFWRLPSGKWGLNGTPLADLPLYGAHELPGDPPVLTIVVEGEPARDALANALKDVPDVYVVGTVTGAGQTPGTAALEDLRGHDVVLWPDADDPGRAHMGRIAERLQGIALAVRIFDWPEAPSKGDAADHAAVISGNEKALDRLLDDLCGAPRYAPPEPEPDTQDPAFDPKDERGLTAALAGAITSEHHFARDAGGKLYIYKDGAYRPDGERIVAVAIKRLLKGKGAQAKWTTHRAREVTEYLRVDAPELWTRPPSDRINVLNGILDARTGDLREHAPDFLSPVQLPVRFDPEAECPAWEAFVAETFPEDTRELAFEIPAWLMTPDTSIQKAILLMGEGANGKSTYLAAVEAFVGRENRAALSLQKIETDRFAAARLVGKLANICPDLPSDHLASTSIFKAVVGGDPIVAEYKYRDSFDVLPFARLVFSANHPPRSGDASHAFYRRWLVVPFNRTFEPGEQTPRAELDARLSNPAELSGILNKALNALAGIKKRGGFSETESTREALAEFQQTTDPLSVWLQRNTVEHPEAMVGQDELRQAYNAFCENSGKPGMTPQAFGRALARTRPGIQKGQRTWRGRPNTRVYLGIGLRPEDPDDEGGSRPDQREQRDQRIETNCFSSQGFSESSEIRNNREKRVDRVADGESAGAPRRLTEEEVQRYQRLVSQGMKPELARAEVLGEGAG